MISHNDFGEKKIMQTAHIEITFEQRETWRVRHNSGLGSVICPFCFDHSPMVAAEVAAGILRVSSREIYRRVEQGTIHFVETAEMKVLICLNSNSENGSRKIERIRTLEG